MNEYRVSFAPYWLFCAGIAAVCAVVAHIWFDPIKSGVMLLSGVGLLCAYYEERERDMRERLRSDLEAIWKKRISDLSVENFCQDMAKLKLRAEALDRQNDALFEERDTLLKENQKPQPPANPSGWRGTILLDG